MSQQVPQVMDGSVRAREEDPLKAIPLFAGLGVEDRRELAGLLKARPFEAHQPIFWLGEDGQELLIVQRGKVRLWYPDQAGSEVTLATLKPGAFFGEISLLDGGPRTASARAEEPTVLLSLDRAGFYRFLEKNASAAVHMVAILSRRQRESMEKLRGIKNVNEAVEERITPMQRLVDKLAGIGASGIFLLGTVLFVLLWMTVQTIATWRLRPELIIFPVDAPPTFFWLGFMVTMVSFLLTIFVLNSQKRQAERDRIRDDMEYQVNLKAQVEVMELHRKVDRLSAMVGNLTQVTGKEENSNG